MTIWFLINILVSTFVVYAIQNGHYEKDVRIAYNYVYGMDLSELFDIILKVQIAIDVFCFIYSLNLIRFHRMVRSMGITTYNYYKIKERKASRED